MRRRKVRRTQMNGGRQWQGGFDALYNQYSERMLFDWMSVQQLNESSKCHYAMIRFFLIDLCFFLLQLILISMLWWYKMQLAAFPWRLGTNLSCVFSLMQPCLFSLSVHVSLKFFDICLGRLIQNQPRRNITEITRIATFIFGFLSAVVFQLYLEFAYM